MTCQLALGSDRLHVARSLVALGTSASNSSELVGERAAFEEAVTTAGSANKNVKLCSISETRLVDERIRLLGEQGCPEGTTTKVF